MNQKTMRQNLKMFLSSFKVITKEEAVNYTEPKGIGAS